MEHIIYTSKDDLENIFVEFEGRFYKFSYPEMIVRYKDMSKVKLSFMFDSMDDYQPLESVPDHVKYYDKSKVNSLKG